MITFVAGKPNTLWIYINNAVDLTGYTAAFSAFGTTKTLSDLTKKDLKIELEEGIVTEDQNMVYGEFDVITPDGKLYLRFLPQFRVLPEDKSQLVEGRQELVITLATTYAYVYDSGFYDRTVTMEKVQEAIDAAIADIGQQTIQNEKVLAVDSQGHVVEMTLAEAVQKVVYADEDIEEGKENHLLGDVKDEDHDGQPDNGVLYLHTEK